MALTRFPETGDGLTQSALTTLFKLLVDDHVVSGANVSDGGGLNASVAAYTAMIAGYYLNESASQSVALTDNATNHVFLEKDGTITVNTTGTPPADSVKLAEVVTSGGAITQITDKRDTKPHDAADIENVPSGNVAATTLQAAIDELDSEKVAKAGDTMAGVLNMGSNRITNVSDPSADQDAATKAYVDAVKQGLDVKESVRVATTANVDLATGGLLTIDGVALSEDDRVLVKNQTAAAENGIYLAKSGAWARASDADEDADVTSGLYVWVEEGSTNADKGFILTTNDPITVGATALTFTQFSGAGQITAGTGLSKSGDTIDLDINELLEETTKDDADMLAIFDDSASAIRKMSRANFLSGLGGAWVRLATTEITGSAASTITFTVDNTYDFFAIVIESMRHNGGSSYMNLYLRFNDGSGIRSGSTDYVYNWTSFNSSTVNGSSASANRIDLGSCISFNSSNRSSGIIYIPAKDGRTYALSSIVNTNENATKYLASGHSSFTGLTQIRLQPASNQFDVGTKMVFYGLSSS